MGVVLEKHGAWAKITSLHWDSRKTSGMGQNGEFTWGGGGGSRKTWGIDQNNEFALGVLLEKTWDMDQNYELALDLEVH